MYRLTPVYTYMASAYTYMAYGVSIYIYGVSIYMYGVSILLPIYTRTYIHSRLYIHI